MPSMFSILSLVATTAAGVNVSASTPSCYSDSGKEVDFAYSFKYPQGWSYAFMDSDTELTQSTKTLTDADSSISKTLMQMHTSGVNHVLWNDQPPPAKDSASPYGHMKGALLFTSSGGIWLTHSLPHFPSATSRSASGLWTDGSEDFGQAFLCITLTAEEIHKISPVMKIDRPVVYSTSISSGDTDTFSDVVDWAVDKNWNEDDMTITTTLKSKGGTTFHVFGKSGNWGSGKDLYRDLVAPSLGELEMEGWRRGAGVWGPACGSNKVLDILHVSFPGKDWITTDDHSKWAVDKSGTSFCVGDINRADGQDSRGGGTVCVHDSSFASQIRKVITETDKCSSTSISIVV